MIVFILILLAISILINIMLLLFAKDCLKTINKKLSKTVYERYKVIIY
jgi:hypothetical protein